MNTEEHFYSKVENYNSKYSCFGKEHDEYLDHFVDKYIHEFIENLATIDNFKEELKLHREIHIKRLFYSFLSNMNKKYNYHILCPEFYNNNKVLPMLILAEKFQEKIINNHNFYEKLFNEKIESETSQFDCVYFNINSYIKEIYEQSYNFFNEDSYSYKRLLIKEDYDFDFSIRVRERFCTYKLDDVLSFKFVIKLERTIAPAGSLTESATDSGMLSLFNKNSEHALVTHSEIKNKKGIISNIWLIIKSFLGFHKSR